VDVIIIVSCRIWELLTDNERWRAVLEVMLRKAAHALAVVRGVRDPSAEGNRNHNKRFAALATETGLAGPERPEKVVGWSDCPTHRRDDGRLCGRHQRDRQRAAFSSCWQVTALRRLT
jgi:hypothetical protein